MKKLSVAILTALSILMLSCSEPEKLKISASFDEYTTEINITLYGVESKNADKADFSIERSREILAYFNSEMNVYDENSAISKINSADAGVKTEIPGSLREILEISKNIHEYTGGAFDIAVMPLVELWNESIRGTGSVPSRESIEKLLPVSKLECFIFDKDSVVKTDIRCKIGLGGIAKGYAVDSVASYLRSAGFDDFIIEAGGDLTVHSKTPRSLGIRHPRSEFELIDTLFVAKGSVASSGDYEKFIIHEETRYSHIINPLTGYGISDCIAVTIVSDKAYLSDAFATAVMVMGREKGRVMIKDNRLSGIIYYLNEDGEVESEKINISAYMKKNNGDALK